MICAQLVPPTLATEHESPSVEILSTRNRKPDGIVTDLMGQTEAIIAVAEVLGFHRACHPELPRTSGMLGKTRSAVRIQRAHGFLVSSLPLVSEPPGARSVRLTGQELSQREGGDPKPFPQSGVPLPDQLILEQP